MRGLKNWAFLALCLGSFATAGCGGQDLTKPPKMFYGRDGCAQCRMIIADERFACAAATADRRFLKFDDIGCFAAHEKKSAEHVLRSWVRNAGADEWIGKEEARFVHSPNLVTPMGYGFAATATVDKAARFAEENAGRVITWEELLSLV